MLVKVGILSAVNDGKLWSFAQALDRKFLPLFAPLRSARPRS
jgi:hypothetical protein